jgi:hypothetical protein
MSNFSRGAALDNLASRFAGILRTVEHLTGVSELVATKLADRDPERVQIAFSNLGATAVVLAPSAAVALDQGFRVFGGGGSLSFNIIEDGDMPTLEWWGLAATEARDVYWTEVRRDVGIRAD